MLVRLFCVNFVVLSMLSCSRSKNASIKLPPTTTPVVKPQPITVPTAVPTSKGDRSLVWNDEFSSAILDLTKWHIQTGDGSQYGIPGWGNNEKQYYQSSNISIEDGKLIISARMQNAGGKQYTSARIRTEGKANWKYGWFEARIKLPQKQQGLWPAFWMLPSNADRGWPASGEIDIMEWIAKDDKNIHATLHYGESSHEQSTAKKTSTTSYGNTWHVYAIEWTATYIKWYLDEVEYSSVASTSLSSWPFSKYSFHFLINMAVGGTWPGDPDATTVLPQTLEVDYVRVYQ